MNHSLDYLPPTGAERDERLLAPYAMTSVASRGRRHPEPTHDPHRPMFQRDRERIVHCRAFRRLMSKTQVLAAQTNDHHRTRLTHSLEVAQISRTIARMLGLNEDLVEGIALSHDLGHPPFGHAGEDALNECLANDGGFDHNLHALRIVEEIETPYPAFPGLNLSHEVREAMAFHAKRSNELSQEYKSAGEPLLEAQVVDAADSLAYVSHDIDDALGIAVVSLADLKELDCWQIAMDRAQRRWGAVDADHIQATAMQALIAWLVVDLVEATKGRLRQRGIDSIEAVRKSPGLVHWSESVEVKKRQLQNYLMERVYRHPWVRQMATEGQQCIRALYQHYLNKPGDLPGHVFRRIGRTSSPRVVCDYLAGMTDRFARVEFLRLCPSAPPV